jgi:hypothetical protein
MYFQGDLRKSFVLISGAGGFGIREDRDTGFGLRQVWLGD